jgi:molecular chaperone DnaK
MSTVVGIDLGTSYSAIAFVDASGKAQLIPNNEGSLLTPSAVLFDGEKIIVGSAAQFLAGGSPQNFLQFFKRQMGNPDWKFKTESGAEYTSVELSAIILKYLKENAEDVLREKVRDAVITVPAYFNEAQRQATQEAGRLAGLNVLRIINEPAAVVLAYDIIDHLQQSQTVLIYDLGGGTFDITIMRVTRESIEIVATGGDLNLGGRDWDYEVMKFVNKEFQEQGGVDLFKNPVLQQNLRSKVETAKMQLSGNEEANIFLEAEGKVFSITLTRSLFNNLTFELSQRTLGVMESVLEDAGLTWSQIDKILLVGGSTHMTGITSLVERETGKEPQEHFYPDSIVALGAALQGAALQGVLLEGQENPINQQATTTAVLLPEKLAVIQMLNVSAHSISIKAVDDTGKRVNVIVLPKDTPIPSRNSSVFQTMADQQEALHLEIIEGEEINPAHVRIIHEMKTPLPPYLKGAPFEVSLEVDPDGIIDVVIVDQTAHRQLCKLQIDRRSKPHENEHKVQVLQLQSRKFMTSQKPFSMFLSYAHKDALWLQKLETHLGLLKQQGLISTWYDRQILSGTYWAEVIDQQLEQASIILFLVSADFLASNYCYQIEMKRALERHQNGEARVIPIAVRPADWEGAPFEHLQALPTGAKAISTWSNQDKAFVDVVKGIRRAILDLSPPS